MREEKNLSILIKRAGSMETIEEHLKNCKFDKYYKKLVKKLNEKSVIVYGTGSMFRHVLERYDLSKLNIIGISDKKYHKNQEGSEDFGYKIIPVNSLENYEPDYFLIATQCYTGILLGMAAELFKDKKTKAIPLVRVPLLKILKEIWFE